MKRVCIYHKSDFDGVISAVIVRKVYQDIDLIGMDYNDPVMEDKILTYDMVVVVDFSLPLSFMEKMDTRGINTIWIDHHQTSIEEYEKSDHVYKNLFTCLDDGFAACELTWRYFYPGKKKPVVVHLAGIYDTWRKGERPAVLGGYSDAWRDVVLPFQYFLRQYDLDPEKFPKYLLVDNVDVIRSCIDKGAGILRYIDKQNKWASNNMFDRKVKGYRALVLNQGGVNSTVFDYAYDPKKHDIMMAFVYLGDKFKVSVYSSRKKDINVAEIARSFGGGGHRHAAGFHTDKMEKIWDTRHT